MFSHAYCISEIFSLNFVNIKMLCQIAWHLCTDLDETRKDAVALFDFRARNEKELSLKKGDTVQLHARVSSEWWRGSCGGQTGLIPHNYIAVQSRWAIAC